MSRNPDMEEFPLPLFHGTSTLFLDSIVQSGLGGVNPVVEWRILEFAREIYPVLKQHLSHEDGFRVKAQSLSFMVEQRSAATNFQHGDTYLSPAESTAVRYAVHERLGSELFSYAVDFLDELLLRKVPGVEDNLYRRYRRIFGLLNVSVAPLLIEVPSLPLAALSAEGGGDPGLLVEQVRRTIQDHAEFGTALLQQTNFRLRRPVPVAALKLWLMSITDPHPYDPGYKLYEVSRLPRLRPDNR